MSGRIPSRPNWVGLAIRLEDGTLWAIELEGSDLTAEVETHIGYHDVSVFGRSETIVSSPLHVTATIRGTGQRVSRFNANMGAPAPALPQRKEIIAPQPLVDMYWPELTAGVDQTEGTSNA